MKLISSLALAAALSFSANAAFADCVDLSAPNAPDTNKTAGISKDGTHAPLETPDAFEASTPDTTKTARISNDGTTAPVENGEAPGDAAQAPQKDGNTMPLATQEGGGNKNLATSQQDVEAQQKGDKTAAATADDACKED
jgi:hypothetical protein